jgi:linoleate 10R-lipoxygenase
MLKRYTSIFRKGGKENASNGAENGTAPSAENAPSAKRSSFSFGLKKEKDKEQSALVLPDHSAKREEVSAVFQQYAQLIHSSHRPLPTQTGDGSYVEQTLPSGLLQDLKGIGFKDVNTLLEFMKEKKAGGPSDDRTYLMERIMQVSVCKIKCRSIRDGLTSTTAC